MRTCALVGVLLLAATACSSSNESASTDTTGVPDALEATLVGSLSLTPGEARCVKDRLLVVLDDDALSAVVHGSADATTQATFDQVLGACSFENVSTNRTLVRTPGQPFTYGDDAELDRLWDACASTGTDVCDELYNRSAQGSEYEAFADSCGGRGEQVACAPGAFGTQPSASGTDPQNYGDDPALDRFWDQCAGGDPQGCLALVFQAPPGSAYATFGESCGGRPDDTACAAASSPP